MDVNLGDKLSSLEGPNCQIGRLDVTSIDSIWEFKSSFGEQPLDVLLNIAGIMPPKESDTYDKVTMQIINQAFAVNAFGPVMLTQALLPNILKAKAPRTLAVVSSRVGSIADNTSGGYYAYRASKTAVNSFFKTLAVELKGKEVVVSMLHPGFTNTNLDPDIGKMPGVVEPGEAAGKLWKIVKAKKLDDTGKFWHREGQELPW